MDIHEIIQSGQTNAWWYLPAAVLLGALHGLEPGHSKTMMAAFIIAIRGTILQAVLLGVSAAVSHSALIAVLAVGALKYGSGWTAEEIEPYLQMISGMCIGVLSVWILVRTRRDVQQLAHHDHHHDHHHGQEAEFQDAHEREHAAEIEKRFTGRTVTTPQIVLFGLTGGLMPCPAAFSVFLICLQLKRVTLGVAMVGAFSVGLAMTMVMAGVAAAWGVRHAGKRFSGFGRFARRAPYISAGLMLGLGIALFYQGLHGLGRI
jgi:nickel/cobalt exporter